VGLEYHAASSIKVVRYWVAWSSFFYFDVHIYVVSDICAKEVPISCVRYQRRYLWLVIHMGS
jgi:hypothetical protein